ncbi:hypothetical protein CICLE_v10022161mg [Citrus x clementina]|uniref:Uncharacterized protein n=1 Tax=Citrus clementina TaxID=85681 RepID=V4VIQ6_CITCL|nr:hypothetical protein CICLE_v10022161mg [Citrus x clementina]
MASSSLTSTLTSQSKSPFYPQQLSQLPSSPLFSFARSLKTFRTNAKSLILHKKNSNSVSLTVKAQTIDFSGSFFEGGGFGSDDDPTSVPPGSVGTATAIEDKEEPQCPPGLRQYETMMVLRPDMSEDERLALTQNCLLLGVACMWRYSIEGLFHWPTASGRETKLGSPTLTWMVSISSSPTSLNQSQ